MRKAKDRPPVTFTRLRLMVVTSSTFPPRNCPNPPTAKEIPVLGLIGTVIGISFAVGGFGQFLGGNRNNMKTIKRSLVNVTGGLSFAFLITLQGLLTSLLIMLPAYALQTREERLYANVQRDISDLLLPALQRAVPEPSL